MARNVEVDRLNAVIRNKIFPGVTEPYVIGDRVIFTASLDGDRSLVRVLEKLHSENRNNVLIVPAALYAPLDMLHALRDSASQLENEMTLQWLPGLGGRKGALQAGD